MGAGGGRTYEDRAERQPVLACRSSIGRLAGGPSKISITNLCAGDLLRCPYVVAAAGIFCWARSDSIPRTCAVSDPTSSDSLTSQCHLSNTYYKGRATRRRLPSLVSPTLTKPVHFAMVDTVRGAFVSLSCLLSFRKARFIIFVRIDTR